MAKMAALAHVDVFAGEAQRVIGLDAIGRLDRIGGHEQGRDLGQSANGDHDRRQDAEQTGMLLDRLKILVSACHEKDLSFLSATKRCCANCR